MTKSDSARKVALECGARVVDSFDSANDSKPERLVIVAEFADDIKHAHLNVRVVKAEWLLATRHYWVVEPQTPFIHYATAPCSPPFPSLA